MKQNIAKILVKVAASAATEALLQAGKDAAIKSYAAYRNANKKQ